MAGYERAGLLARRHALVVGVDGQVGSAVVRRLAAEGCRVVFTSADEDRGAHLLARTRDLASDVTVLRPGSSPVELVRAAVRSLGALDLLVVLPGAGWPEACLPGARPIRVVRCDDLGVGQRFAPEEWAAAVVMIAAGYCPSTGWDEGVRTA